MTALLDVRDLVKTYGAGESETRVLRGLNLALQVGEMAALLGAVRDWQKHAADHSRHADAAHIWQSYNAGGRSGGGG